METAIPIRNLYHLLCYAWERMEERDLLDVGAIAPPKDVLDLLGRVLVKAVAAMIRQGFERGYRERQEELAGIRGRIALVPTLRRELPRYGWAECVFDDLEHDTPANRIIRATLTRLICSAAVNDDLRHEAAGVRRHFRDVAEARVTASDCRRILVHRNNRHYGFALHLCEQVLLMLMPDETGSGAKFRDFTRDHKVMARLFEKFVRNYYAHHWDRCGIESVGAKQIAWAFDQRAVNEEDLWPGMKTDICVKRRFRPPLVIDCKFYHQVLKDSPHGKSVLSAENLYQIFAYVQNIRAKAGWFGTEGLLLYAQNGRAVEEERSVLGARIRAATVDMSLDWGDIENRLRDLILK